jgi:hypothetical protein
VFDPVDFVAGVEQRLECGGGFVEERSAAVLEPVLRKVAHCEAGGLHDKAGVGFVEAGEHGSRVVLPARWAGEADAVASPTCQVTLSSKTRSPKILVRPES